MSVEVKRREIDEIDAKIAELLAARERASRWVQEQKASDGRPLFDAGREAAVVGASTYPEVTAEVLRRSKAEAARLIPIAEPSAHALAGGFTVVAGPCSAESPEQLDAVGAKLSALGVRDMRAGAWKPRTSRGSFQGHGALAVRWMREVCDRYGLRLWTEVRDVANIVELRGAADVVWVGARNGQNFELLRLVGEVFPKVVLKRGAGMSVEEWVAAAEYVSAGGAAVALCERGIRSFDRYFRNTLDLAGAAWAKRISGLEVIADVSHSTGLPALAVPITAAARAAGLDGVMAETHPRPRESVTDAGQALSFTELETLVAAAHGTTP